MLTLIRSIARRLVAWCYAGDAAPAPSPQPPDPVVTMTIPLEEVRHQIAEATGVPIEHVKLIALPPATRGPTARVQAAPVVAN